VTRGLATDVDEQADGTGRRGNLSLGDPQRCCAVDHDFNSGFRDVDLELDPLIGADIGGRFVAAVRVLASQPIEWPVGIREVRIARWSRGLGGLVFRPLRGRR
jgi:hypothetical protein